MRIRLCESQLRLAWKESMYRFELMELWQPAPLKRV